MAYPHWYSCREHGQDGTVHVGCPAEPVLGVDDPCCPLRSGSHGGQDIALIRILSDRGICNVMQWIALDRSQEQVSMTPCVMRSVRPKHEEH